MEWYIQKTYSASLRTNQAAVVVGDLIYTFGGYVENENGKSDNENAHQARQKLMDVNTFNTTRLKSSWLKPACKNMENAPFQRYGHVAVAFGELVCIWGGNNDHESDGAVYFFNTKTLEWSKPEVDGTTSTMPAGADGAAACAIGDFMYLFGGCIPRNDHRGRFLSKLYRLDMRNLKWTVMPAQGDVPTGRDYHTINVTPEGNLVMWGGREHLLEEQQPIVDELNPNTVHMYNMKDETWQTVETTGNAPCGRRSHCSVVVDGKLYIFGGSSRGIFYNDIHFLCLDTMEWVTPRVTGAKPKPRRRASMVCNATTAFMFGGSAPEKFTGDGDHDEFEPLYAQKDLWGIKLEMKLSNLCRVNLQKMGYDFDKLPIKKQQTDLFPVIDMKEVQAQNEVAEEPQPGPSGSSNME